MQSFWRFFLVLVIQHRLGCRRRRCDVTLTLRQHDVCCKTKPRKPNNFVGRFVVGCSFVLHMQCHGRLGKLQIQCHCQSNSAPMKDPNVKRNWEKAQLTLRQTYIPRYWRWARETFNKFHVQCQSLNAKKSWWKVEKKQTNKAKLVHFWLKLKAVNHVYFQRWKICVLFEQKFQHSD